MPIGQAGEPDFPCDASGWADGPSGHLERKAPSPPGLLDDVCPALEAVSALLVCYKDQETGEALAFALSKGPLRPPREGERASERATSILGQG